MAALGVNLIKVSLPCTQFITSIMLPLQENSERLGYHSSNREFTGSVDVLRLKWAEGHYHPHNDRIVTVTLAAIMSINLENWAFWTVDDPGIKLLINSKPRFFALSSPSPSF